MMKFTVDVPKILVTLVGISCILTAPLGTETEPLLSVKDYAVTEAVTLVKASKQQSKGRGQLIDQPVAIMDWNMQADAPLPEELVTDTSTRSPRRRGKKPKETVKTPCETATDDELMDMLGPAFNGRYMSISKPVEDVLLEHQDAMVADGSDATTKYLVPFSVGANFARELPPDFYTDISWYHELPGSRTAASAQALLRKIRQAAGEAKKELPWECKSEIVWTDLGTNYYPRYLRNVRCTRANCWFGHFKCRPKAFTVNVLKRVRDSCKDATDRKSNQEWIYEERAVTFCCECVEY